VLTKLTELLTSPSNWHRVWTPLVLVVDAIITVIWMGLLAYGFASSPHCKG